MMEWHSLMHGDAPESERATARLIAFGEKSMEERRKARREALARDLLLKLVESHPHDREWNVRAAVEYTDALLAKLDEGETR